MKKIFLGLTLLSLIACKDRPGGNKAIIAAEEKTETSTEANEEVAAGIFKYNQDATKLTWTAFKTPEKIGVGGTFDKIILTGAKENAVADKVLENTNFSIETSSVNTGAPDRDAKLNAFFFKGLPQITGKFGVFKDGKVPVTLKMNGKEVTKQMTYTLEGRVLDIKGKIDIVSDFGAGENLKAINQACLELHKGKTWSDVEIEVKAGL